ncbi:MAG: hypothetical protein NVSMB53_03120 [Gemmatimonadaceae bacterium]
MPTPEAPPPSPGRRASPAEELSLIRADSELFAAIVRAQLEGKANKYPYNLNHLRYDSRPYGTASGYPEIFAGVQGIDPTLTFAHAGRSAIADLIENRKRILESNGLAEGGPLLYPQCAGALVPPPPPVPGSRSSARAKRADVHAGCPKTNEYYLTVGLPIRGQPPGLRTIRDSRGELVTVTGDVWTALVDEHAIGPRGWTWSQYAWLFRRSRWRGRLELAATILIGVVE